MKIPTYKRVRKEDFPTEFQDVVETLGSSINDGLEQVNTVLQGRVDLKNNIYCQVKEIDIAVDSSGIPTIETIIQKSSQTKLEGMEVIQATNLTNTSVYPTSHPFITFTELQTGILLNHITGLPVNNTFRLKTILWF